MPAVRLNKFLSQSGIASRREADRMILDGRVLVNGRKIRELGTKIDPAEDEVEVEGKRIGLREEHIYLILNKPPGYLVTLRDPFGRPTVIDLLPRLKQRVFPVGRLDEASEGLLLLMNDGELANRLIHPRYEIKKTYVVEVKGNPAVSSLEKLRKGIVLDGKKTAPAQVSLVSGGRDSSTLKIGIHEGKKREVRRMCEAVGHPVLRLQRQGFADLSLGDLKPGEWRTLTSAEILKLKKKAGFSS